jgi:hypothetical protein
MGNREEFEALETNIARQNYRAMLAAAPTPPVQNTTLPPDVLHALRFYANGEHFSIDSDAQEFDTVSGEPGNWLHSQKDDDCTIIEDDSIAKAVLQGKRIDHEEDEPESVPIEGEIYSSAPPAPEVEPFGYHVSGWRGKRTQVLIPCERLEEAQSRASKLKDAVITPIYTHPADDGLRKAAEALLDVTSNMIVAEKVFNARITLRAELDKGKS